MSSTFMDAPSQTHSIKDATLKNPTLWKCLKGREIAILVKNVLQVQLVRSLWRGTSTALSHSTHASLPTDGDTVLTVLSLFSLLSQ
jgi:hypothetical protein